MGESFSSCLCLLTDKEMNSFHSKEAYLDIGNKYFGQYTSFALSSKPRISKDILSLLEMMAKAVESGQRLLIHCNAGVGRACTMAICLLLMLNRNRGMAVDVDVLIKQVSESRGLNSVIENIEQKEFIKTFSESIS